MMKNTRLLAVRLAVSLGLSLFMTGCGGTEEPGPADSSLDGTGETDGEGNDDEEEDMASKLSHWTPMGGNRPVKYFLSGGIDYEYITDEDAAAKIADISGLSESERRDVYLSGTYCIIKGLVDEEVAAQASQTPRMTITYERDKAGLEPIVTQFFEYNENFNRMSVNGVSVFRCNVRDVDYLMDMIEDLFTDL